MSQPSPETLLQEAEAASKAKDHHVTAMKLGAYFSAQAKVAPDVHAPNLKAMSLLSDLMTAVKTGAAEVQAIINDSGFKDAVAKVANDMVQKALADLHALKDSVNQLLAKSGPIADDVGKLKADLAQLHKDFDALKSHPAPQPAPPTPPPAQAAQSHPAPVQSGGQAAAPAPKA